MKTYNILPLFFVILLFGCAGTGKFYKLELSTGDIFTGTLESNIKIKTARGALLDIPANNILKIEIGSLQNAEVELRDGNEIKGKIENKKIKLKLSATGKTEEIDVSKIERMEMD